MRGSGKRSIGRNALALFFALAVALQLLPASIAPATAQEHRAEKRRNLFDFLFGGALRNRQAEPPAIRQAPSQSRRPLSDRRAVEHPSRAAATSQPPSPSDVAKLDNARVVLVVGDFLAGGLAEGLEAAYSESPGVRVVNRSNGSSGFVRDDYYDWNAEIAAILDETGPTLVVMMIGSNDRQQMVVGDARETPRSDAWLKEYERRVELFTAALGERDIPLIWTGLPAFKLSSMTSDMLAFNDIYKNAIEAAGGAFVDIWEGFVDENGAFIFNGPDMNGQPARLRGSDGINLTRAGKRKVAFYVEKPLNKLLGEAVSPDIGELGMESLPDLVLHPEKASPVDRTLPISLADPALDGGTELLGAVVRPISEAQPEADAQTNLPLDQAPSPGRADDFFRDSTGSVAREPASDAPAAR